MDAASCTGHACTRCSKPASLQCPKCVELALPKESSVFCSQECFKGAWKEHKAVHKAAWLFCTNKGRDRSASMPTEFVWTGALRPERVGPKRTVPDHIPRPDYASGNGIPYEEMESKQQTVVRPRSQEEIDGIRAACQLARHVLDAAHAAVRPGVTTDEIDAVVHKATVDAGAYPSPLNYFHFPKSVCTSVNEVICHGIPDRRPLVDGDIVNVDVTAYFKGYHGDLNETYVVGGGVDERSKKLVRVAYECLDKAIKAVRPGMRFREVGDIITEHARASGMSVVRAYCGHGIGDLFHCAPNIPHYAGNKAVGIMREGQTFTIEPMINLGTWKDRTWPDGWTAVTDDGQRSAQFEHTLVVTKGGCEVLTARTADSPPLWWEAEERVAAAAPAAANGAGS